MPKKTVQSEGLTDTWGRNNRKLADKNCDACSKQYRPRTSTSRFCSRPCQWSKNGGQNRKKESWWINPRGYIEGRVWIDEQTQVYVKQHRWIMQKHLDRDLLPTEDVHHLNEIKTDNRIENLQIIDHGQHATLHNLEREYETGYKMNISDEERSARSERMKESRLWELGQKAIAKALA
jgi:hypothetical protein|nr:MAG TPA: HNH endonuclease [Caudoviricetes sp.]